MRYYSIDIDSEDEMRSRVPHPQPISAYARCDTPVLYAGEAYLASFTSEELDAVAHVDLDGAAGAGVQLEDVQEVLRSPAQVA